MQKKGKCTFFFANTARFAIINEAHKHIKIPWIITKLLLCCWTNDLIFFINTCIISRTECWTKLLLWEPMSVSIHFIRRAHPSIKYYLFHVNNFCMEFYKYLCFWKVFGIKNTLSFPFFLCRIRLVLGFVIGLYIT